MLEYKGPPQGYYGRCVGGPYDGKSLHHGEPVIAIALHKDPPYKTLLYVENSPIPRFDIHHGHYRFDFERLVWTWEPPPSSA